MASQLPSIAQLFRVNMNGGVYITSVDLFFEEKDTVAPVIVDVRPINLSNRKPATAHVPFSRVVKNASSIVTSSNGGTYTRFSFEAPVFLENGREYCLTVHSASSNYKLWYGALAQSDVLTGASVDRVTGVGKMFRSLNDRWQEDEINALKMTINRARFDTSATGTVVLNDLNNAFSELSDAPFQTIANSNIVRVRHVNNGFFPATATGTIRSKVKINIITADDITGLDVNGIPFSELSGEHDVLDADIDHYTIATTTRATSTGRGGSGYTWVASRNLTMNFYRTLVDYIEPAGTDLRLSTKLMNGRTLTDTSKLLQIDTSYKEVPTDRTVELQSPKTILNRQTAPLSDDPNDKSVYVKADMTTDRNNLSPVIDLQRASILTVATRLNNPASVAQTTSTATILALDTTFDVADVSGIEIGDIIRGPGLPVGTVVDNIVGNTITPSNVFDSGVTTGATFFFIPVDSSGDVVGYNYTTSYADSTAPEAGSVASKYITKRVNLDNAASTVKVIMLTNRPSETDISVYVKLQYLNQDVDDFDELPWTAVSSDGDAGVPVSDNKNKWDRVEFTHEDVGENIQAFAVKVELKSTNSSRIPKFKNFKAIALV